MSKARDILLQDRAYILWLFDGKCVRCGRPTNTIHEIVPISHGRVALKHQNRVPLCDFPTHNSCHEWAHSVGTNKSIPILQKKRAEFLLRHLELDTVSDEQND